MIAYSLNTEISMVNRASLGFAAAALLLSTAACATEPLQDRIWYQSRAGTVHQEGAGPIALPPSTRLRAMAIADGCSARGGPRGVYKYMSGKIWLAGLHRCEGGVGLHEVYPDVRTPPVASWISGVLVARLGKRLCSSAVGTPVYEAEVRFTVVNGVVHAQEERFGMQSMCAAGRTG